jgi:hypothetical protein
MLGWGSSGYNALGGNNLQQWGDAALGFVAPPQQPYWQAFGMRQQAQPMQGGINAQSLQQPWMAPRAGSRPIAPTPTLGSVSPGFSTTADAGGGAAPSSAPPPVLANYSPPQPSSQPSGGFASGNAAPDSIGILQKNKLAQQSNSFTGSSGGSGWLY